jgi:hypothetical protein
MEKEQKTRLIPIYKTPDGDDPISRRMSACPYSLYTFPVIASSPRELAGQEADDLVRRSYSKKREELLWKSHLRESISHIGPRRS